jgi:hypothetical protein
VIAATLVLNANNIQVQGTAIGIPVVTAPNIGALTAASNAAGSANKVAELPTGDTSRQDRTSIIIVEVLGYGGGQQGEATDTVPPTDEERGNKH